MIGELVSSESSYTISRGVARLVEKRLVLPEDVGNPAASQFLRAVEADLPLINTFYPLGAYNTLSLIEKTVEPIDQGQKICNVTLVWEYRPAYQLRMSATLRAMETNLALDPNDNQIPIFTQHQNDEGEAETQGHLVEIMVPEFTVEFTARYLTQAFHPLDFQFIYVGKTNSTQWPLPLLDPPGTWLCTSIDVPRYLGLGFYEASIGFSFRAEGWKTTVVHQEDNRPIPSAEFGSTLQTYTLYEEADFTPLNVFF